jgi:hypothetical protein
MNSELIMPIASDPHIRVQDVSSDPWRHQNDANNDRQKQHKKRHETGDSPGKDHLREAEKTHQVDLLA